MNKLLTEIIRLNIFINGLENLKIEVPALGIVLSNLTHVYLNQVGFPKEGQLVKDPDGVEYYYCRDGLTETIWSSENLMDVEAISNRFEKYLSELN